MKLSVLIIVLLISISSCGATSFNKGDDNITHDNNTEKSNNSDTI